VADIFVEFEVVTVVAMKNTAFWDVTPCSLVDVCQWLSKTFISIYQTTQCHMLENSILQVYVSDIEHANYNMTHAVQWEYLKVH
jgi:hypothetical protein